MANQKVRFLWEFASRIAIRTLIARKVWCVFVVTTKTVSPTPAMGSPTVEKTTAFRIQEKTLP